MNEQVVEHMKRYVELSERLNEVKDGAKALLEEFKSSPPYSEYMELIEEINDYLVMSDQAIRNEALVQFQETGNKSPFPGTGIREYTIVEYDEKVVVQWAMVNLPSVLKLDTTKFEKVARTIPESLPDYVKVYVQAKATTPNVEKIKEFLNEKKEI